MAGILVNQCKTLMLDERLLAPPFDDLQLGLFTGATIPTVATVLGDLTEVTGTGYARANMVGWSAAILTGDDHSYSEADDITFLNTSAVTAWTQATGWFWHSPGSAVLVMAGRFTLPFTLAPLATYRTTPTDQLTGE